MDWSKSKTIMIFVLLVLNIVLLANILAYRIVERVPRETIANTRVILENRNVRLKCDIPEDRGEIPAIIYENNQFDKAEIVKRLTGITDEKGEVVVRDNQIIKREKRIILEDGNTLLYVDMNPEDKVNINSMDDIEKFAGKFLSAFGIRVSKYKLDEGSRNDEGEVRLVYIKRFGKYFVYDNRIDLIIGKNGVKSMRYSKSDVKKLSSDSVKVMPAYQVLLKNFNKEENVVIKAMDIGFKSFEKGEEEIETQEWPKWRVVLDDGTERFFNAVNGDEFLY